MVYFFPGLFREDSDLFQPDNPFEDSRVREAFARAVDRKEINTALFGGIGTPAHILSCHPTDRCFDTQFEDDFTAAYTYDPERAKQLLAEAGYPDGFPFGMAIFEAGTFADLGIVTEFIAAMAFDVGFQPEFVGAEYSEIRPAMVDKTLNPMFGLALINRPMTEAVEIFNYSETVGPGSGAERVYLYELYERANQQSILEERYFVEIEIAAYKFYEYLELPLLWLPATALVNADTVANYTFPGTVPGVFSHLEYVEPLR